MTVRVTLRDYQTLAVEKVQGQWQGGVQSTLLCMATGTGKTETFLGVLHAEMQGRQVFGTALILAHRQELIHQPYNRIMAGWPDFGKPGVLMANETPDWNIIPSIIIASMQTVANEKRLRDLLDHCFITHLVIDEAHHAVSPAYKKIIEAIKAHNPDVRILGVTATPKRTDHTPLAEVFTSVAHRISIKDAIQTGCLVPFRAIGFSLPVSVRDVQETGEGWDNEQMGTVLDVDNVNELVYEKWREQAEGRPTIAFTSSVKHAYDLAQYFTSRGVPAEAADAKTMPWDRDAIFARAKSGETKVIVNCFLWTEGLDLPFIDTLLNVRPTKSDLVYIQMAGRVLRLADGKREALILDFAPEDARDMVMAGDLLGKPREQRDIEAKAEKKGVVIASFGIDAEGNGIDAEPDELRMRFLDYLSDHRIAWTFDGKVASASIGNAAMLAIQAPDQERINKALALKALGPWNEKWEAGLQAISRYNCYLVIGNKQKTCIASEPTWEAAKDAMEKWVDEHPNYQRLALAERTAKWRKNPASEKQRALLERFKLWRDGMTSGEASQTIAHFFVRQTLERKGA